MFTKILCTVLFLLTFCSDSHGLADIGKHLKLCDRNSADVNDCLVDAIQTGLGVMADGIQEFGVPPVDPYHQKELRVEYKRNQIVVKMTMKDIYVHGLKSSKVQDARLRADDDHFYLEVDMTTPRVFVHGVYLGEGSYNSLQINTTGAFNTTMSFTGLRKPAPLKGLHGDIGPTRRGPLKNFNLKGYVMHLAGPVSERIRMHSMTDPVRCISYCKDLVYTWKLSGTPETINNDTYVRIDSFYMRPDVGDLKSYISNDNPSTREFTDLGNGFANANWKTLYRELLPYAQANWNKIGIRVANKIFLKVRYGQLFPIQS